jgi:hypothetical protein
MTASIVGGIAGWLAHLLMKKANNWWDRSQCSQSMFLLVTWLVTLHPPGVAARSLQSASHLRLLMPLLFLLGHSLLSFLSKQVFSISCGLSRSVLFLSVKSPWWTQLSTPNIIAASLCSLSPLINPAKSCALAFSIPAFDRTLILASFVALDH